MKKIAVILLLLTTICLGQNELNLKLPGWQIQDEALQYTSENLWEYINGAADQFLSYNFQHLRSADYQKGKLGITVDIYDMGTPLNAFGIYSLEKPKTATIIKAGTESALAPPFQMLMLKDRLYIKCNIFESEYNESEIKEFMKTLAASIKGSEALPEEFNVLPEKERIPGSEKYTKEGFQGVSALQNCISADFGNNSEKFQYFYMFYDAKQSNEIWDEFKTKWKALEGTTSPQIYYKKIPYKGYIGVIQYKKKIWGITNCKNTDTLTQRAKKLIQGTH